MEFMIVMTTSSGSPLSLLKIAMSDEQATGARQTDKIFNLEEEMQM